MLDRTEIALTLWLSRLCLARFGGAVAVMHSGLSDGERARESLRKESRKSCLNRLERLGKIEFAELTALEELDQVYNDIVQFTDFRQGAANGSFAFRGDHHEKRSSKYHTLPRLGAMGS